MKTLLKNYTVLFADDDSEYSSRFSKTLSYFFKEVRTVDDGEEAYNNFIKSPSDIVILDLQMPKLNGLEVSQKIREINTTVPIFIVTNYQDFESAREGYKYELIDFLVKPVSFETLLSTLKRCETFLSEISNEIIEIEQDIFYDKSQKTITNNKVENKLTNSEIIILEYMLSNRGKIITTVEFENLLFNENQNSSSVRNIIYKLRQKISNDLITNISKVGYLFK